MLVGAVTRRARLIVTAATLVIAAPALVVTPIVVAATAPVVPLAVAWRLDIVALRTTLGGCLTAGCFAAAGVAHPGRRRGRGLSSRGASPGGSGSPDAGHSNAALIRTFADPARACTAAHTGLRRCLKFHGILLKGAGCAGSRRRPPLG